MSFLETVQRGQLARRFEAARTAEKAVHHGWGHTPVLGYGSTGKNWAIEAGDLHANGVVATSLGTLLDKIRQGSPMAGKKNKSGQIERDDVATSLALNVLHSGPIGPNFAVIVAASLKLYGMAWVWKIYEGSRIVSYVPYMDSQVRQVVDSGKLIYKVRLHGGGTKEVDVPAEEMIPIGYGTPDPRNPLFCISPLMSMLREVAAENECSTFLASVLANMGFPGAIVSPKGAVQKDASKQWVAKVKEALETFTRDRRGGLHVAPEDITVTQIGFNASQMQIVEFDKLSITKICAAVGVDPMAAGLPSENKTYANYGEARKALIEDTVFPLWDAILKALTPHLIMDGVWPRVGTYELVLDKSQYPEVKEDKEKADKNTRENFKAGILERGEARKALGCETDLADKRLFFDIMAAIKVGQRYKRDERASLEVLHANTEPGKPDA